MEKRTRGKRNEIATEFYFRDTNRNTKDKFVKGNAGRKKHPNYSQRSGFTLR